MPLDIDRTEKREKNGTVPEHPVNGYADCSGKRPNKTTMVGYQASPRGGNVPVEVRGKRVMLGGEGAVFAERELAVG